MNELKSWVIDHKVLRHIVVAFSQNLYIEKDMT